MTDWIMMILCGISSVFLGVFALAYSGVVGMSVVLVCGGLAMARRDHGYRG